MKRKARLKDIAEALNISTTTVSRALNNKEDISAETKRAVLEVAKILNYRPNYFAKSLHHNEGRLIGAIVPRVNHSFYAQLIDGILHQAQEKGYVVLLAESMDSDHIEQECIEQFLDINIAALIIAPAYNSRILQGYIIDGIDKENVIVCDRTSKDTIYNQITNDHKNGSYKATVHLIESGLKNIGHIRGLKGDNIADEICDGYTAALLDHNLSTNIYQCKTVDPEESYLGMIQLNKERKLQGLIAISDEAALGVYRYCYDHDIKIPKDLSLIGYSNALFAQYLIPSLSTIDQRSREIGIKTINMLHSPKKPVFKMYKEIYKSSLIIRESSSNK